MVITRSAVGTEQHEIPVLGREGIELVAQLSAAAWSMSGRALAGAWERPLVVSFQRRAR